jgi:flagellar hook-basal body complex protein FliE
MDLTTAAIGALDDGVPVAPWTTPAAPGHAGTTGTEFGRIFEREISQVDSDIRAAETSMRDYASGKPVELHELMIQLERARLSVQVFVQVRNKIVESYQDLMRMQT